MEPRRGGVVKRASAAVFPTSVIAGIEPLLTFKDVPTSQKMNLSHHQDEIALDNLFCVAFKMLDAQWLAKRASYMEFNDVLKATRAQLERVLALENVSSAMLRGFKAHNKNSWQTLPNNVPIFSI